MVATTSKIKREIVLPKDNFKWCTVALSEVVTAGKRLEAAAFDIDAKRAKELINTCKYPKCSLIDENGFIKKAFYGSRLKRNYIASNNPNAIGFIGSAEMLEINPKPAKFMEIVNKKTDALKVEEGTLLLSRSGTIGNIAFANHTISKFLVSEHAIRLQCKEFPGYVYCFLKSSIGQKIIKSKVFGAVILEIELEHLADIPDPNPPKEIKEHINDLIIRSFDLRDQSNALIDNATRLFVSALNLPPIDEIETKRFDNTSEINNFSVKLSNTENRIDASYHVPIVEEIVKHLRKNAIEVTTVGDRRVSKDIILPGRFKRVYVKEGHGRVFFGGKQLFELDPSNKKYLSLAQHGTRIKQQLELKENMSLVTCSGTIGKVTLTPKHWEGWAANQHIIRIVPVGEKIAGYLYIFLSSDYGYPLVRRFTYGSVVDEIDANHVSQIPFPLLKDRAVQDEINNLALKANALRYEAYELEQRALRIMNEEVIFA